MVCFCTREAMCKAWFNYRYTLHIEKNNKNIAYVAKNTACWWLFMLSVEDFLVSGVWCFLGLWEVENHPHSVFLWWRFSSVHTTGFFKQDTYWDILIIQKPGWHRHSSFSVISRSLTVVIKIAKALMQVFCFMHCYLYLSYTYDNIKVICWNNKIIYEYLPV